MGKDKKNPLFKKANLPFHLMLFPGVIIVFIYSYLPMAGLLIAFEDFKPYNGFMSFFTSEWVGLEHFRYLFGLDKIRQVIYNTVFIAFMKIILGVITPVTISILLNEIKNRGVMRSVQTFIYLPHFVSWVILGGLFVDMLSPSEGIVNKLIMLLGFEPIFFLGDNTWFPYTLVITDVWKSFGFATIVYFAAISNISPTLYEAAIVDGAGHMRRMWHITLPGMMPIVVLLSLLSLGRLLNAGFDQVFNLYNPAVMDSGDIIDTFVYRIGLIDARYSLATAVGLFKSLVSTVLITISYYIAYRFANYRIF